MKVIGKTDRGYLVEATTEELTVCAGYRKAEDLPGWSYNSSRENSWQGKLPIGTTIDVTAAHTYLQKLREAESPVKAAAKFMRELAGMVEGCLPTTIVLPDAEVGAVDG